MTSTLPRHHRTRYAPRMAGFVSYLRVSTKQQEDSGLGLEAQRAAIAHYIGDDDQLHAEFIEIESGKSDDNRPELHKAFAQCRIRKATLIVAKLDRLSRNAAFLLTLRDSGASFICADMPEANTMTVGVMALVAQHERETISRRTKEALEALKAQGKQLGGYRGQPVDGKALATLSGAARGKLADAYANDLRGAIEQARKDGATSLQTIADHLNAQGITTRRGGRWNKEGVRTVLARLE